MHDRNPFDTLRFEQPLRELKRELESGEPVLEKAIQHFLLKNGHRVTLTMVPDTEMESDLLAVCDTAPFIPFPVFLFLSFSLSLSLFFFPFLQQFNQWRAILVAVRSLRSLERSPLDWGCRHTTGRLRQPSSLQQRRV